MAVYCSLWIAACRTNSGAPDNSAGSLMDIDGNVYKAVKIGNQIWMAENFRTTRYNDGTAIPLTKDDNAWNNAHEGAYCYYNNTTNPADIDKYGALYNLPAVNAKHFAPKGWHVPTCAEALILQNYLMTNSYAWGGTKTRKVGDKIAKSMAAQTDWAVSIENAANVGYDLTKNNASGLSILPAGYRGPEGKFYGFGGMSYWWDIVEKDAPDTFARSSIYYDSGGVYRGQAIANDGLSVRLIKDSADK
jgi:uncharacterized protein (TIGR02145 family)